MFRKIAIAALATLTLAVGTTALTSKAEANPHWGGHFWGGPHFHGGFGWGGPGIYFGTPFFWNPYPFYDDEEPYYLHRYCSFHRVRHHHHWVVRRYCYLT